MKPIIAALALLSFSMAVFAASDCEHTCCREYSGWWDDDFDDCKGTKDGYDACVSECEAAIWENRPQIDTSGGTHYECKVPLILLSLIGAAVFLSRRLVRP